MIATLRHLLRNFESASRPAAQGHLFTGLDDLDALLPGGGFARGAMHEILGQPRDMPILPALLAATISSEIHRRQIIWCDSGDLYPPALGAMGISLEHLLVLQPKNPREELWAMCESLRCAGVGLCVAGAGKISRLEARRLQLAAERGGGIGILLRSTRSLRDPYAAATRWIIHPACGERNLQRWRLELIHGHGGRVGHSVFLEASRELSARQTLSLRAFQTLAHRQNPPPIVVSA